MKIHILSDLHLEFQPFDLPETDADILILAGDTATGKKGIEWIMSLSLPIPVIYIMGNHEYYRSAYPKLLHNLKEISAGSNVHVLENDVFQIDNIRFLGCTLWTDFKLYEKPVMAEFTAQFTMNDYRLIRKSPAYSKFHTSNTITAFRESRFWLNEQLQIQTGKTIVITHHAPSARSIPEEYKNDDLNPAFASNLEDIILKYSPDLWIHGHIHAPASYNIGKTQIVCNPRGYPHENFTGFNPEMTMEL